MTGRFVLRHVSTLETAHRLEGYWEPSFAVGNARKGHSWNRLPPWPGAKLQRRQVPLAIGWYSEAEWRQVKAAATDAERFEQTFQAWETMAERALNDLRAQGLRPTRFNIIANDLLAWCLVRNKQNDAAARALFVSEQVAISK